MMGTKVNVDHEIEVELESHELAAVRRLRYLDDIMTDVLDSARASGTDGFVMLTGNRFAFDIRCDPRCSRTRAEGTRPACCRNSVGRCTSLDKNNQHSRHKSRCKRHSSTRTLRHTRSRSCMV